VILISCGKEETSTTNMEEMTEYYPFEEGTFVVYSVDSISLEAGLNLNDTVHFQIKEIQDSMYVNGNGDLVMRLKRFKRYSEEEPWLISDIWTAQKGMFNVQRVEENVRKICIGFPISDDNSWDVNALNTMDSWTAGYESIGEPISIGGFDFDNSVKVKFEDNFNLIERESAVKIFVKDIGLVRSHESILKFENFIPLDQDPTPEQIELGRILTYTLIDYGTE